MACRVNRFSLSCWSVSWRDGLLGTSSGARDTAWWPTSASASSAPSSAAGCYRRSVSVSVPASFRRSSWPRSAPSSFWSFCGWSTAAADGDGEARLLHLDQLDRFPARSLDHDRARVAERVGRLEERNLFRAQLGDPGIEVGDAERDVVVQLSARTDERHLALAHVPGEHHIAEGNGGRRHAER